jgi:exoribonuclease-2
MGTNDGRQRAILRQIARRAMVERGLLPDFSREAIEELAAFEQNSRSDESDVLDLRNLLWVSIDNDDSRDLDQLSVLETLSGGAVKILIAVADVDALVKQGSAIDTHAKQNTTSVYAIPEIFPMLPEKLSTDLTSLKEDEDRLAVIVEMVVDSGGSLSASDLYRARVRNHAKLAYNGVAAWLDGHGPIPEKLRPDGLPEQIRMQDRVAQQLKTQRSLQGALGLETLEARPVFEGESIRNLELQEKNRARELIENLMITANGITARYLEVRRFPSFRRIVRSPERWGRIVELAARLGDNLPAEPDSAALDRFLARRKTADPLRFPDLSLAVVKLMGRGEYIVEFPGESPIGHFGLAVKDYTHATAPNRRFPDLITQRLLKAALRGDSMPYRNDELKQLAWHCTEQEDDANKVERLVRKAAAALLLESRIGHEFEAMVTGASEKGTWVRLFDPPVEGKLQEGFEGLDVGDILRVRLTRTDVERGYIDFARTSSTGGTKHRRPRKRS